MTRADALLIYLVTLAEDDGKAAELGGRLPTRFNMQKPGAASGPDRTGTPTRQCLRRRLVLASTAGTLLASEQRWARRSEASLRLLDLPSGGLLLHRARIGLPPSVEQGTVGVSRHQRVTQDLEAVRGPDDLSGLFRD